MGMMLPNELVWVLEKLGFEWPDIDEDEVRRAAGIVRDFGSDLESVIQSVDRHVNGVREWYGKCEYRGRLK